MPSIPLHPPSRLENHSTSSNPLPSLLQTPSGLAIVEIQGTIHAPEGVADASSSETPIGQLIFPHYSANTPADDTKWMKRVYLYVGKHQRLTGEVKKLPKPYAIMRKRNADADVDMEGSGGDVGMEELEIVEVVKYKIVFAQRPEPVGVEEG